MRDQSLGRKTPWRRKGQATPVFLPGESPWAEEPGKLQSMGLHSQIQLKWLSTYTHMGTRAKCLLNCIWGFVDIKFFFYSRSETISTLCVCVCVLGGDWKRICTEQHNFVLSYFGSYSFLFIGYWYSQTRFLCHTNLCFPKNLPTSLMLMMTFISCHSRTNLINYIFLKAWTFPFLLVFREGVAYLLGKMTVKKYFPWNAANCRYSADMAGSI